MPHFFTYRLTRAGRIVRVGKGSCTSRTQAEARRTLKKRYPRSRWNGVQVSWHANEGAAFKGAARLTEQFRKRTGTLPPRNARGGGSGGRRSPRCRRVLRGERCPNQALVGNYGFCGRHR